MADAPVAFLPLGAIIQRFAVNGRNIVQGFDTPAQYTDHNAPYFGETIGRVANRISNARLTSINGGKSYALVANDRSNSLHGGKVGWGKRVWAGPKPVGVRGIPGVDGLTGGEAVEFTLLSEDGDEGYPGTVEARVTYTTGTQRLDSGKDALVLGIEYEAKLVAGAAETPVNMTNHSYFNLSGVDALNIAGTTVTLATNAHLPVDDLALPTGGPEPYTFDTSKPFTLGVFEPFVDHCFVVNTDPASVPIDTRSQPLVRDLQAHNPSTGIHLEVFSTEPAFQFYTGDMTAVPAVDGLPLRGPRCAFCCEPSRYINAVNEEGWKNMVMLKQGETYGSRIVYKAWSD